MGDKEHRAGNGTRLVPMVTFGLSVAVLAGVAVVPVASGPASAAGRTMTTAALGAAINDAGGGGGTYLTTCCGPN